MDKTARSKRAQVDAADETRTRLTDAALRCIARWGISKTGLGDIAKEAGCARQTVYNHFADADAVISAALFGASAVFVARLREAIVAEERAGDRIITAMTFCLRELPHEPMLQLVVAPDGASLAHSSAFRSGPPWALVRSVAAECLAPEPSLAHHEAELAEMMTRLLLSILMIEAPGRRSESQTRAWLERWLLPPLGLEASPRAGRPRLRRSR